MKGNEEFFAEKKIELGRSEFVLSGKIYSVCDQKKIVFVILDFWQTTGGNAVFDRERMELEYPLKDGFDFFVSGIVEIDPQNESFITAHQAQGLEFKVAAYQFTITEDKRMNHSCGLRLARAGAEASPGCGDRRAIPLGLIRRVKRAQDFIFQLLHCGDKGGGRGGGKECLAMGRIFDEATE